MGGLQAQAEKAWPLAFQSLLCKVFLGLGAAVAKRLPMASSPGPRSDMIELLSGGWREPTLRYLRCSGGHLLGTAFGNP